MRIGRKVGLSSLQDNGAQVPVAAPSAIEQVLMRMQAQINSLSKNQNVVQPGALLQYYGDLASGDLPPEDMRIEDLRFTVQIDPSGAITNFTQPIQVISRYNFAIRRIMGFAMNPVFAGAGPSLVSFNMQDAGRNFPIFKTSISMQSLLANGGAGNILGWDGTYITIPGTQLQVNWTVDSRWSALVGTTQEYGIQIVGDLVACAPQTAGA